MTLERSRGGFHKGRSRLSWCQTRPVSSYTCSNRWFVSAIGSPRWSTGWTRTPCLARRPGSCGRRWIGWSGWPARVRRCWPAGWPTPTFRSGTGRGRRPRSWPAGPAPRWARPATAWTPRPGYRICPTSMPRSAAVSCRPRRPPRSVPPRRPTRARELRLLELAATGSLPELREECARVTAAADPDPEATNTPAAPAPAAAPVHRPGRRLDADRHRHPAGRRRDQHRAGPDHRPGLRRRPPGRTPRTLRGLRLRRPAHPGHRSQRRRHRP